MWFKKATIYKLHDVSQVKDIEDTLNMHAFVPVGEMQETSFGWAPVRDGELFLRSHGGILLYFMLERKKIPGSALKTALDEACAELAEKQGFAPGKKARAEIKERVRDELLGRALPSRTKTGVWIDTVAGRVILDTSTVGTIDLIHRALITHSGVEIGNMPKWCGRDMSAWLLDEDTLPLDYTIDDSVQMEYPGERGTLVAFRRSDLDTPLVTKHVEDSAVVTQLAMTYKSRISFQLQVAHAIHGIKPLDILKDVEAAKDVDMLENDFVLMQLELRQLIDSLTANAVDHEKEKQ